MSSINPYFSSSATPNEYFNVQPQYVADKLLYDSIITECYNKFGVPMIYYSIDYDVEYDKLFGEDMDRLIERKFHCMGFYELQEEIELFTRFGIEGIDNFHIYISKKHFEVASTYSIASYNITGDTTGISAYPTIVPKRGDIMKSLYNNRWYEIVNIQAEQEQFLQNKHSWDLIVKIRKDEHMTVAPSLSGDAISAITNMTPDIYDVSATVDSEKVDVLYAPASGEKPPQDPFNNW